MTVFIDADGCPVVDITLRLAKQANVDCIIICDTSHMFDKPGVRTITVPRGDDSVDFTLVNMIQKGDIIVTQDYGLAAMCLARGTHPINQDGLIYDDSNIDRLLMQRHTAKKIRKAGGRVKGPAKRVAEQDKVFEAKLSNLLNQGCSDCTNSWN